VVFDGRNVRWLAINTGSGTAAIGDTISQGGVSGYFLGFWSSLTAQPSLTIGATGFIKLREVTGGNYAAGALTFSGGGAATATSADVTGWIEIVADASTSMTFPRLGKHTIRGDWFYLANTNGTLGQQIQLPTNGGGVNTFCPGVWVETAPSSNTYEYFPALTTSSGWARQHIGAAVGETDKRQNFVKDIGNGLVQFGESSSLAGTYANLAAQVTAYSSISHTSTYTVVNNLCTITYTTGHFLKTGAQVGVDFTSGGASALDNIFTITVLDAFTYTFALTTADTSGNATVRPGISMAATAHALGVGDTVYCDFTTGTGVDGQYTVYSVGSTSVYFLAYPHIAALTGGNVSIHSRFVVTFTTHALALGNRVHLDFTTGAGVDGIYTIVAVPDANTFHIVANNGATATSGNVSIRQTIGNVPVSGCTIRIPNVILRECPTAARATNQITASITTRPEWLTTSAGAIDFEYAYTTWYMNFSQPYSVRLYHSSTYDSLISNEVATALDIDDMHTSMYGSQDVVTFNCTSNFAGGAVKNCKFQRGNAPGTSDHAVIVNYSKDIVFTNVTGGIIQYGRSSGKGFFLSYDNGCSFINCRGFNTNFPMTACINITISNYDHCDRYIGYTTTTSPNYAFLLSAGCSNIDINGISFGFNGTVPNVHPHSGLLSITANNGVKLRNGGSKTTPLACGSWRPNYHSMRVTHITGGNNDNIKYQRLYIDDNAGTGVFSTVNSDNNITYESVHCGIYVMSAMAVSVQINAGLNSIIKNGRAGNTTTTGQASVYGSHFQDIFLGDFNGRFILTCNEPTVETISQFTMVSGVAKFNSAGGILMGVIGNQAIFEDSCFRLGHTGFQNTTPSMSGGVIGNFTLEYDIDLGTGYTNTWSTLNGTNLSAISVNPAIGFKMKIRITTTNTNAAAITHLRIDTVSTAAAQENVYPLDTVPITIKVLDAITKLPISGARVYLETSPAGVDIFNTLTDVNGNIQTSFFYESDVNVVGRVRKSTEFPFYKTGDIIGEITSEGFDNTILLISD